MARILYGDDDGEQLRLFRILLESQGHELLTAAAPAEVLQQLAAVPPDLVIVDLRFPTQEEGVSLLYAIRDSGCAAPVILLSGVADTLRGSPEEQLVDRLMMKPAPVSELLRAIDELTR